MDITDAERVDPPSDDNQDSVTDESAAAAASQPHGRLITEAVYRLKKWSSDKQGSPLSNLGESSSNKRSVSNVTSNQPESPSKRRTSSGGPHFQSATRNLKLHDESAEEMMLRLSNEFQPIIESGWDTVIYIGPPVQEHQQDDHEYEYIKQHFSKPYLMNSETLKNAGSAQFTRFLGPMSARAERRLKKLGIHHLIPQDRKPKYFIDLRPMQDEDEALLMITELTCTPGVLSWHISHLASGVPKSLIGGRDDLNVTTKPHTRAWMEAEDSADDQKETEVGRDTKSGAEKNILDLEPEYSTIRHYMAIERLLHALSGRYPKLNSAAKVWTYFSIAKFFDCATNPKVNTWIFDWLFTGNNSNFVQANPEVAYRMAMGMRSPEILKATFAMLVGERALLQAGKSASDSLIVKHGAYHVSVHGRLGSHLDDDEINRIDHAAHSLTQRMTTFFGNLAHGPLDWTPGRSELLKFRFIQRDFKDQSVVDEPFDLLREYVTGELYQALSQNVEEGDLMRLYRTKGFREFGWLKRSRSFADAYNAMPLPQRLLTQSFWAQLENYGLYQESERVIAWSRDHSLRGLDELAPDFGGVLPCVTKQSLCGTIEQMNQTISKNKTWARSMQAAWNAVDLDQYREQDVDNPIEHIVDESNTDQEVVRAVQGLGVAPDPSVPGWDAVPFQVGTFDDTYPYAAVAGHHRLRCGSMHINPAVLLAEMSMEMRRQIMRQVLTPGYVSEAMGIESEISLSQMDILMCLNDEEWKYLPLWAGGLDDGSGGVFAELDVPDMEAVEGFRGGKMGLGGVTEGSSEGSFTMVSDADDFDEVMTDEGVSTVGKASRNATDGTTSAGGSTVISLDE